MRLGLVAALAVMLIACGGAGGGRGVPQATAKYEQTWPKSYGDTTCSEWLEEMTSAQQFTGAADMLVGSQ